jgi:hypothetical protein
LNRNGELEPNETSRIDVRGSIVNISSPTVSGVPLTATYGLNVSTGERNVITIAGLYDYVFGKAIRGESWTDDTVVESYVARLSYIPNMAPLELNNSEIVHKLVTAPIVAQDTYEAIIGGGEVVSSRPPPARGVVFVKAVDFDEKPLVDVNVTVLSGEKVVESRVTDLNGLTSFSLEAGNYTLKVQKDGFEPVELSVTIEANKETTVSITLEKKPSIIEEFLIQSKLFITKYWLPLTAISIVLVAIAIIVRRRH